MFDHSDIKLACSGPGLWIHRIMFWQRPRSTIEKSFPGTERRVIPRYLPSHFICLSFPIGGWWFLLTSLLEWPSFPTQQKRESVEEGSWLGWHILATLNLCRIHQRPYCFSAYLPRFLFLMVLNGSVERLPTSMAGLGDWQSISSATTGGIVLSRCEEKCSFQRPRHEHPSEGRVPSFGTTGPTVEALLSVRPRICLNRVPMSFFLAAYSISSALFWTNFSQSRCTSLLWMPFSFL